MSEIAREQRQFSRVEIALPVSVRQGESEWHQSLIDISLRGLSTDQPEPWDAHCDEPFTLIIDLDEDTTLELHADMQYAEAGRVGFSLLPVDLKNIEPLRAVMEAHLDIARLEEELSRAGLGG